MADDTADGILASLDKAHDALEQRVRTSGGHDSSEWRRLVSEEEAKQQSCEETVIPLDSPPVVLSTSEAAAIGAFPPPLPPSASAAHAAAIGAFPPPGPHPGAVAAGTAEPPPPSSAASAAVAAAASAAAEARLAAACGANPHRPHPAEVAPGRSAAEPAAASEAAGGGSPFVSASLQRDSAGRFKIMLQEDASGTYISKLPPTNAEGDGRDALREGDYVRAA